MALTQQIIKGKHRLWQVVVGLEVHAQLLTKTKLFSPAVNSASGYVRANSCVHPFDAAIPGTLPQVNGKSVELAIRAALLLNSNVNHHSRFERKHYFYCDLPHGYQITQQRHPLASGGALTYDLTLEDGSLVTTSTAVTRIQLEIDSAKTIHDADPRHSFVDLNRAGCGLIEIVFEPDIRSAAAASSALKTLQELFRHTDICDGNMAEGSMRCDVNVSVESSPAHSYEEIIKGDRVEVKNVNSFRHLTQAINFEATRQVEMLERGEQVTRETRGFDPRTGQTKRQRTKEGAVDYRFFYEPDLPPLIIHQTLVDQVRQDLPETPQQSRQRLMATYQLSSYDAEVIITAGATNFFERLCVQRSPKVVANWVSNNLLGLLKKSFITIDRSPISEPQMGDLIDLVTNGSLSGTAGQAVLEELIQLKDGLSVHEVVQRMGLSQITSEETIRAACEKVVNDPTNKQQLAKYLGGKENLFMYLVGRVMKETQGRAAPALVDRTLREILNAMKSKRENST